jgi:membrane protein
VGRVSDLQDRAKQAAARAEAMRAERGTVDAAFEMVDRDGDVGGGILSGALAYRIFIWLLPFSLVLVAGIGLASAAADNSAEDAANSLGLQGVVAHSIAEASRGSSRWYALLIGLPVLVWATRSLLRALIVVHRLVWAEPRRMVPKPTLGPTLRLLLFLVAYFAIRELSRWVGSWADLAVLDGLVGLVLVFAWWLLLSMRLPHRDATWADLVPGALVMSVGLGAIALVGSYAIAPRLESSVSAYGALGIAATLLFGLYIVGRLVVFSAVVNATIWDRRAATDAPDTLGSPDLPMDPS